MRKNYLIAAFEKTAEERFPAQAAQLLASMHQRTAARNSAAVSATATTSLMTECTRSFTGAGQKRWGVATTAATSVSSL